MEAVMPHIPFVIFFIVGTIAIASSLLVVAMRNPVHSALFLLLTFLCVAILFVLVGGEFVGAVQILVYAGGIMVLFLFVVMLINVRHLPDEKMFSAYWMGAIGVGLGVFILFVSLVRPGAYRDPVVNAKGLRSYQTSVRKKVVAADGTVTRKRVRRTRTVGNSEAIGMQLYRDYLVPFEVASVFLLVAMIGAIVIGKRELEVDEEEITPAFILERAAEEKRVKELSGA